MFLKKATKYKRTDLDKPHRQRGQGKFVNKTGDKIDPERLRDAIYTLRKLGYNEPLVMKGDNLANYFTLVWQSICQFTFT